MGKTGVFPRVSHHALPLRGGPRRLPLSLLRGYRYNNEGAYLCDRAAVGSALEDPNHSADGDGYLTVVSYDKALFGILRQALGKSAAES